MTDHNFVIRLHIVEQISFFLVTHWIHYSFSPSLVPTCIWILPYITSTSFHTSLFFTLFIIAARRRWWRRKTMVTTGGNLLSADNPKAMTMRRDERPWETKWVDWAAYVVAYVAGALADNGWCWRWQQQTTAEVLAVQCWGVVAAGGGGWWRRSMTRTAAWRMPLKPPGIDIPPGVNTKISSGLTPCFSPSLTYSTSK